MTTQTTLSDAELIVKGYNAIIEDAQYEFEDMKEEVLLQLEDIGDEAFHNDYEEFELRLEAYEAGAFDPDIEKILGYGPRKGSMNPFSQRGRDQARRNRDKTRAAKEKRTAIFDREETNRENWSGKGELKDINLKGGEPGGRAKGAGRGYKGGDLSDRDTFAGAVARKLVAGKRKLGAAKGKVDQRENIGRAIGAGKDRATARVADTATAGKEKAQAGGSRVASGLKEGKRRVSTASDLISGGVRSAKDVIGTGKVQARIYPNGKPIDKKKANRPADPVKPPVLSENKPKTAGAPGPTYSPTGKRLFYGADGSVTKSFTARLRKSMGYRPRRRYDDRLPW